MNNEPIKDEYYPPEEQGSEYEDFLRCPSCKSPFLKITAVGDQNRQFVKEYECVKCGATFEA